ncbi:protein kinase domain-containing protein [Fimbriiglobus ruber]|uniref:Serine/threonine protein kinase n=1 Tax=Fimbriiglobus ruber TaxID=1908690 RepID=A0A225DD49_9BACT|nr:protein kinase [Fimbriiglobus ruber]OWK39402.1 Serine/threonine protein kinase [Fimbriiglobus ruber]
MPPKDACPNSWQIEGWAAGSCTPTEAERLAAHLEVCPACARLFGAAEADGTFCSLLRGVAPRGKADEPVDPPSVRSLMEQLCHLPPAGSEWAAGEAEDWFDAPAGPDEIGRLGVYRVFERVGAGGMGVVFRAEDVDLARPVALKLLRPRLARSPGVRRRFLSEARTAAGLNHDNVVVIYQVGEVPRDDGESVPFIAMEFLEGSSLADWFRQNPYPSFSTAVRFAREIASGLAAAHARGVVHRDIKPGNVWVESIPDADREAPRAGAAGGAMRIRLLDFGIACSTGAPEHVPAAGTPGYMAPEQARGGPIDHRADLYSLGCILTQMLTGQTFPTSAPRNGRAFQVRGGNTLAPRRGTTGRVPRRLNELVRRLLAPRPTDRPASARVVEQELHALETRLAHRSWPWSRVAVAAGVLVVTLVGAAAWEWEWGRGTIEVEVAGGPCDVVVTGGKGEVVRLTTGNHWQTSLPPGHYSAVADEEGAAIEPAQFTIQTGQTQRLTLTGSPDGPVNAEWLKYVTALSPDRQVRAVHRKLKELNPGFSGKSEFWAVEDGLVTQFRVSTDEIRDISPVQGFPGLRMLGCYGSKPGRGKLADLSPLRGLPLKGLCCWNNPLADLSPLRGMRLTEFQAEHTRIDSLEDLKGMPIITLTIQNTKVRDLSPVAGMPLWGCFVHGCPVDDLGPLASTPVQVVRCDFRPARDTIVLKSIKTLVNINSLPVDQFWRSTGRNTSPSMPPVR